MLQVGQLFGKKARVVIVDEGDGSDNERLRIFDGDGDQPVTDQIAKGFGAIGVTLLGDKAIEASQ